MPACTQANAPRRDVDGADPPLTASALCAVPFFRRIADFRSKPALAPGDSLLTNGPMTDTILVNVRIPVDTQRAVQSAAERAYLTRTAWLRRAIDQSLRAQRALDPEVGQVAFTDGRSKGSLSRPKTRMHVQLQRIDAMRLQERAALRGMPVATYASVLLRAHLGGLNPLPKEELEALKGTVAELSAIGRNLNQLARAAHTGHAASPSRDDLEALLSECAALRFHVKGLLKANLRSWMIGYVEDQG